jgi:hypothetical protein
MVVTRVVVTGFRAFRLTGHLLGKAHGSRQPPSTPIFTTTPTEGRRPIRENRPSLWGDGRLGALTSEKRLKESPDSARAKALAKPNRHR